MSSMYKNKLSDIDPTANTSSNSGLNAGIKLKGKALDLADLQGINTVETLPCAEKMTFDAQKPADIAAMVAAYQHGTKLKSYICSHCGLWHLASA